MVSLLNNGSCFRKVAPNTRSSEKSRIGYRGHVSGCMANVAPAGQMSPLLYSSPPTCRPRGLPPQSAIRHPVDRGPAPICAGIPRPLPVAPTVSPHVSQRYGCASRVAVRRCGGAAVWPYGTCQCMRDTRTACMYKPIPTSSGWIATAAQKLWSPGSSGPWRSPMLGAASRGPWGSARLLSLL